MEGEMSMRVMAWIAAALIAASAAPAAAQGRAVTPDVIETVTLHALHREHFACGEHGEGELEFLGDALGADCVIQGGLQEGVEGGFVHPFRADGARNEDWYGWNAEVLAPFDGTVVAVRINPVTNQPGQLGRPPASLVVFERADGMRVIYAHVQDVQVAQGDTVRAGQVVARVGNNGYARNPHIHVGAWKGQTPYQIRWDLRSNAAQE
jgi:murein DD-endopeptidase MepM/ murein hydrolase activator NlpD